MCSVRLQFPHGILVVSSPLQLYHFRFLGTSTRTSTGISRYIYLTRLLIDFLKQMLRASRAPIECQARINRDPNRVLVEAENIMNG